MSTMKIRELFSFSHTDQEQVAFIQAKSNQIVTLASPLTRPSAPAQALHEKIGPQPRSTHQTRPSRKSAPQKKATRNTGSRMTSKIDKETNLACRKVSMQILNHQPLPTVALVLALLIQVGLIGPTQAGQTIHFELLACEINGDPWLSDIETAAPTSENRRYLNSTDATIDLLLSSAPIDLWREIKKSGTTQIAKQILRGKNLVQSLVSDTPVRMSNLKGIEERDRYLLSFETSYVIGQTQYHTIEKYYLFAGKGLHAVLRWREDSQTHALKEAKSSFNEISVRPEAGTRQ